MGLLDMPSTIVETICKYLAINDRPTELKRALLPRAAGLNAVSRTCRSLRNVALAIMWKDVTPCWRDGQVRKLRDYLDKEPSSASLIRHLHLPSRVEEVEDAETLLQQCVGLTSLTCGGALAPLPVMPFVRRLLCDEGSDSGWSDPAQLAARFPSIQELTLRSQAGRPVIGTEPMFHWKYVKRLQLVMGDFDLDHVKVLTRGMPRLQLLHLEWNGEGPFLIRNDVSLADALRPVGRSLVELRLRAGDFFHKVTAASSPARLHALAPGLDALRKLSVQGLFISREGLANIAGSNLEELELKRVSLDVECLVDRIERDWLSLRRLQLTVVHDSNESPAEGAAYARLDTICRLRNIMYKWDRSDGMLPFFFAGGSE